MDSEDERVAAGMVVKNDFGGRVGEDAAVPIELVVDAYRRKGGGERAGGHDLFERDRDCRLSK